MLFTDHSLWIKVIFKKSLHENAIKSYRSGGSSDDCCVLSHIISLKNAIALFTAASTQPNSLWFWVKYIYIYQGAGKRPQQWWEPEGPKGPRATIAAAKQQRWLTSVASLRARRARERAWKASSWVGACQCYYIFLWIQHELLIFMPLFGHLPSGKSSPILLCGFVV